VSRLVEMVAALDERPALDETDALLAELRKMPRDHVVTEVMDALLDYRVLLTEFNERDRPDGPS
jgi:hypothetical protein